MIGQCDPQTSSDCQTAATQYFRKVVQGLDRAETFYDESSNQTFALNELGNIGEIKWDTALCLLLSWLVAALATGNVP